MTRQFVVYVFVFVLLYLIEYYLHTNVFKDFALKSPIDLKSLYIFHVAFTFSLSIAFLFLSTQERFKAQLGFLYLFSLAIKIFLFCVVFRKYIFNNISFTNSESSNMLIVMVLPLFFEVFFISKILKSLTVVKND